MAGRIRTLKPEILENARTGKLDDEAWRLFVSMILMADDYGNLYGDPDRINGTVFWSGSPRKIRESLARLSGAGLIEEYEVSGQPYIAILGWFEHQRVDKPGKPRVPQRIQTHTEHSRDSQENSRESPGNPGPDLRSVPPRSDPDLYPERESSRAGKQATPDAETCPQYGPEQSRLPGKPTAVVRRNVDRHRAHAEPVLAALNAARKRVRASSRVIKPTYDSLALIAERLEAGKSAEDCLHVVAVCESECRARPESYQWFDAVSPFRRENFERKCAADASAVFASGFSSTASRPVEQPRPRAQTAQEYREYLARAARGGDA